MLILLEQNRKGKEKVCGGNDNNRGLSRCT